MTTRRASRQKMLGAFYTPPEIARALVRWAVRKSSDRLLDPACGDGRFLAAHRNSVGVERDVKGVIEALRRSRCSMVHAAEFFSWAANCRERFDCAAGNPPFIRYQHFAGAQRKRALLHCAELGASFSGLTSSWAPFLVATANLLKPGGRMAFLVPAEIGHAPYARPLVTYLARRFAKVVITAVKEKLFPELSEDVWILYAEGFGEETDRIQVARMDRFDPALGPPQEQEIVALTEWARSNYRLRASLLPRRIRELYFSLGESQDTFYLQNFARIGIGYVTGANDFFHLRPSVARSLSISERYLIPSVRNGRSLRGRALTTRQVQRWLERDDPVLLLRLPKDETLEPPVRKYLDSPAGAVARSAFKCRSRNPWYVVPDVRIPDGFLSYMSGEGPRLVANAARCSCTNSVHAVTLTNCCDIATVERMWQHSLTRLSCEIEGHPLGGGMLKLEPGECGRILLPGPRLRISPRDVSSLDEGTTIMRRWRHYG